MPLEDLEKKLYISDKEFKEDKEKEEKENREYRKDLLKEKNYIPEDWEKDEQGNKFNVDDVVYMAERFPLKKIIFWGLIWIFIAAVIIVGYLFYQAFTFSGISIQINVDEPILSGAPFNVTVNYDNNSPSLLNNTKISLTLPNEFSFVEGDTTRRVQSENIGTVGIGSIGQQAIPVIALRGEGTCANVVATIEYSATSVGSSFEKSVSKSVCVSGSAATLSVLSSKQVFSNETFDLKIEYKNISRESLHNLELRLEYPQNFTFQGASLKPDQGDNIWRLGDLRPASTNQIDVQGSVIAQADSFFEIKVKLVSMSELGEYVVVEKPVSISVSQAPLSISISVQNSTNHIAKADETLNYVLKFRNNSDIGFRDVVIKAKLLGEMFNYASIAKEINFNSITKELTWNKSTVKSLGLLPPGVSGTVEFKVKVSETFPIARLSDKDFKLEVQAQIDSPTVPSYISATRTISIASLKTKVAGKITVDARGLFRDAPSGIVNRGPLPPRVNTATNYTIHWIVKNYGTDVSNVEIRAFLRPGVKATGIIKSNIETMPVYNERTQEMVWNISKIQATRGVISDPIEAIFQIEALPAVNQVNTNMPLLAETKISALDLFTNLNLDNTAIEIDTSLNNNDPTVSYKESRVAP